MTTGRPAPPDQAALLSRLAAIVADSGVEPAGSPAIARAPGRVNLIGEHTDYNGGFVLPAAIDLETWIAFQPTADRRVELTLAATGERDEFDLDDIGKRKGAWIDYVAGVALGLLATGRTLRGLRGVVAGTLPQAAGLGSSAALELAAGWAMLAAAGVAPIDPLTLARLAQRAENEYVGVACGLMDQFASANGRRGEALLLDCRSLEWRGVRLPLADHALVVCHSGSERRLGASAYNERRRQCEAAVAALRTRHPAVESLRDVDRAMLDEASDLLDAVSARRARHVVEENERVLSTAAAFESGDLETVGRLWAASHASLRDLYEVGSAELDALVEIATTVEGVVAARMTGAGFGGSTVNLIRRDAVDRLRRAVEAEYRLRTGRAPAVLPVEPAAGAGLVTTRG
ncbi:MAG TPA: galactokinase [Candidatus Limnocylindrales bacterium]|nr:galactokinase [Candidatus Limnocylindrales bacterium]